MFVRIITAAIQGITAIPVGVEINTRRGIGYTMVGLPDSSVREGHERIRSALKMSGMDMPSKLTTINMTPADLRKEGSGYDLPLAVGFMVCNEEIPRHSADGSVFIGELSLDGSVLPVRGVLPIAVMARDIGCRRIFVPADNAAEAAVVDGLEVYAVKNLKALRRVLSGEDDANAALVEHTPWQEPEVWAEEDFINVKGQQQARRALEIACSGGHNVILVGSPGSGKSMMAKCIPGILPPMTQEEALTTTKIHSVAGKTPLFNGLMQTRPFRAPHHSVSSVAMIGGGRNPQPGEISLANGGVLYLDEFAEFPRNVLEVLRQPLENRSITISRAEYCVDYPADFMLVASMNPCPCGYYGHPTRPCACTPTQVQKYMGRISGPLLDRIDLHIQILPVSFDEISSREKPESSAAIRERVIRTRAVQTERFREEPGVFCNAQMNSSLLAQYAALSPSCERLMKTAVEKLQLSARAYSRILKVARTIADMDRSPDIRDADLAEAIQYRALDRSSWGREW